MSQEVATSVSPTLPSSESTATVLVENDLILLQPPERTTAVYDKAAALESQFEQFKTERKQERFMWLTGVVGLIDTLLFVALPWYGAIFGVLFSLVLLLVAARVCEVPWIVTHLERIFDRASGRPQQEPEEPPSSR